MNNRLLLACLVFAGLTGCSMIRTVDDKVSSFLEPIPGMKFLGVESRKSIEEAAKAKNAVATQESLPPPVVQAPVIPKFPDQIELSLDLESDRWLNPNAQNKSSPVHIKVFQLEKLEKFKSSSLISLLSNPSLALGADLKGVDDYLLLPGEKRTVVLTTPRTSHIAILANYRTALSPKDQNTVNFTLNNAAVQSKTIRFAGTHVEWSDNGESHAQHTSQ